MLTSEGPICLSLNLERFKVEACASKCGRRECPYAHNPQELRRRLRATKYSKDLCPGEGCVASECSHARNAYESRYHPDNFRKKICQEALFGNCGLGRFCHSVHANEEAKFRPLHLLPLDRNFLFFSFKSEFCPYSWLPHHAFSCVYAHNWQDFKRPYSPWIQPISCPRWSKESRIVEYEQGCPQGFNCTFCHGWKELEYHPSVFKTVACKKCGVDGPGSTELRSYQSKEALLAIGLHICCFRHPGEAYDLGFNKKIFHAAKKADHFGSHSTTEFLRSLGLEHLTAPPTFTAQEPELELVEFMRDFPQKQGYAHSSFSSFRQSSDTTIVQPIGSVGSNRNIHPYLSSGRPQVESMKTNSSKTIKSKPSPQQPQPAKSLTCIEGKRRHAPPDFSATQNADHVTLSSELLPQELGRSPGDPSRPEPLLVPSQLEEGRVYRRPFEHSKRILSRENQLLPPEQTGNSAEHSQVPTHPHNSSS